MLDIATVSSWLDPVTYAAMQMGMLATSHATEAVVSCFVTWKRLYRLIILVVMKVIGVRYTIPIREAVTSPATIAAASVLIGATAEYASYDAYPMPINGYTSACTVLKTHGLVVAA
jgi:hypothetical protein